MPKCLIYSRVSIENGNSGLENQEAICREYATTKAYEVAQVFKDTASGSTLENRDGLDQLFTFLEENTDEKFIVVVADIERLARNIQILSSIKSRLSKYGASLEVTDLELSESESILDKILVEVFNQFDKDHSKSSLKLKRSKKLENA